MRYCSAPFCSELVQTGRCKKHEREVDRAIKVQTADRRAIYNSAQWQGTRRAVLERDPVCTWQSGCMRISEVADHYPRSLRQILDAGDDPFSEDACRGLCASHHSKATREEQQGVR